MKTLLIVLLPFLVYSQNPYPDTIFLIDGRTYPCLISQVEESKVNFIYANQQTESVILLAVDKINMQDLGEIYSNDGGYKTDLDEIENYISERMDRLEKEKQANDELKRLSMIKDEHPEETADSEDKEIEIEEVIKRKISANENDWSFGVLYVPYYSGKIYGIYIYYNPADDPQTYFSTNSSLNMEAQLSYKIVKNFRITFDLTYLSSYIERREEFHDRQEGYEYNSGDLTKLGLNILDFSLGLKYYIKDFVSNNVSVYVLAGMGKQFAFAENSSEDLFPPDEILPVTENNIEDYLKKLNSPLHFNFGFGAEYYFNESLSLTSNIRFIYSTSSADYDYRSISEFSTTTNTFSYTYSEFVTRVGLGINFYF